MRTIVAVLAVLSATSFWAAPSSTGIPDLPGLEPARDEIALAQPNSKGANECRDELQIPDSRTGGTAKLRFSHSPKYGDIVRTEVVETLFGVDIRMKIVCTDKGERVASFIHSEVPYAGESTKERPCDGLLAPSPDGLHFGPPEPAKPISYIDPKTRTLYYVESDGRHLAAITDTGRLLWVRDPFEDAQLCPYRTIRPIIVSIRSENAATDISMGKVWKRKGPFIGIAFNSSQSGVIDAQNGDFFFEGQD